MIELVYSNMTERLLETLAKNIQEWREHDAHPLDPVELVAPNRNLESWIRLGLARSEGVAANLRFRRLERFIGEIVSETCPGILRPVDLDTVEAAVLAVLLDDGLLARPELQPVYSYLHGSAGKEGEGRKTPGNRPDSDGTDIRRGQLASRLAYLFM